MRRVLSLAIVLAGVLLVVGGAVLAGPQGPWIKDAANPVLLPGPAGSWDGRYVYGQAVIKDGAGYQMWYTGFDESMNSAIGYATSTGPRTRPIPCSGLGRAPVGIPTGSLTLPCCTVASRTRCGTPAKKIVPMPSVVRSPRPHAGDRPRLSTLGAQEHGPVWRVGEVVHTFEADEEEATGQAWDGMVHQCPRSARYGSVGRLSRTLCATTPAFSSRPPTRIKCSPAGTDTESISDGVRSDGTQLGAGDYS